MRKKVKDTVKILGSLHGLRKDRMSGKRTALFNGYYFLEVT